MIPRWQRIHHCEDTLCLTTETVLSLGQYESRTKENTVINGLNSHLFQINLEMAGGDPSLELNSFSEDDGLNKMFANLDEDTLQQILNDPDLYQSYFQENYSILHECIKPSIIQAFESAWVLLLCCLTLRLLGLLKLNERVLHVASCISGLVVLWHFYGISTGYTVLPCVLSFILYQSNNLRKGGVFLILAVVYLLACEKLLLEEQEWNKIRGSVMIICMKIISLVFDQENGILLKCNIYEFYGYILNPASVIFGPFLTYAEYSQISKCQALTFNWILHVIRTLGLSIGFLVWSTCGTENVLTKVGENRWLVAYREANAFRSSHYFVSFLSEASCILCGIGTIVNSHSKDSQHKKEDGFRKSETKDSKSTGLSSDSVSKGVRKRVPEKLHSNEVDQSTVTGSKKGVSTVTEVGNSDAVKHGQVLWEYPVARPLQVEIPRSLVDVVTNWNLPMHYWLKTYVFKPTRKFGVFPAILLTYLASSLLHGLNFQLSAVLLSIGIFAYIENAVRHTLAEVFSACIQARRCRSDCTHRFKQTNPLVITVNLLFGLVAIWNLAYLGCLFDGNPEVEEKGYSMTHALRKWANLHFLNHWTMLAAWIVNKVINW